MTMFDEFLKNCRMEDEIKPSKKRIGKNIAALRTLVETEENGLTKRKFSSKPLIIAAAIAIVSGVSLLSVSAAIMVTTVSFFMSGEELDGEYFDYVDSGGYRHISFRAVLPIDENNFAIIYDIDAPQGENMRVITDETDPDFMEKLRLYRNTVMGRQEAGTDDFGLVFKDSELCSYRLADESGSFGGTRGGNFMHTVEGKASGYAEEYSYDDLNKTKTFKETFYYYVGKE